jgi:hypothetical protein
MSDDIKNDPQDNSQNTAQTDDFAQQSVTSHDNGLHTHGRDDFYSRDDAGHDSQGAIGNAKRIRNKITQVKRKWPLGRTSLFVLESVAAVACLATLAAGGLLWRLHTGPLDVSFASEYLAREMYDEETGYQLAVHQIQAEWPEFNGPLILRLKNVAIDQRGDSLVTIRELDLALSKRYLLLGQIAPVGVMIENPAIRLKRTKDNEIVLLLDQENNNQEQQNLSTEDQANILMDTIRSIAEPAKAGRRTPVDRLRIIEIKDARMVMEDHMRGVTWFLPDIDLMFMRDRAGLLLTSNMILPKVNGNASAITIDAAFNRNRDDVSIKLDLANVDPKILTDKIGGLDFLEDQNLIVNGDMHIVVDGNWHIHSMGVNFDLPSGDIFLPNVFDEAIHFDTARLNAHYNRADQSLVVSNTEFNIQDVIVRVDADMTATPTSLDGPLTVTIPKLPQENLAKLWPIDARDTAAAQWLTSHIRDGSYSDFNATVTLKASRTIQQGQDDLWTMDATDIKATMALSEATVDYRAPLPAAKNVSAVARFADDHLVVDISKGIVGGMNLQSGKVVFDKLINGDPGLVDISLRLDGSVPDIFNYIKHDPIDMDVSKQGIDVSKVAGDAQLDVNVKFPALKDLPADLVKVDITGQLNNIFLPNLVKDMALSGGPFELVVDDEAVKVSGAGKLDTSDLNFSWSQFLSLKDKPYSYVVDASLVTSRELRNRFGANLDDYIEGTVPVTVQYKDFGNGRATVDVDADVTPSVLKIEPFNYYKVAGVAGNATTTVTLQNGEAQKVSALNITTPELTIQNAELIFGKVGNAWDIRSAVFPTFKLLANDFNLIVDLPAPKTLKLTVKGNSFDARPFMHKERVPGQPVVPYQGPSIFATIHTGRIATFKDRFMNNARVTFDMAQNGDIRRLDVDAIAGRGAVQMRLGPYQNGIMAIRLMADDAGAALKASGMYENVLGGKLSVIGQAPNIMSPYRILGTVQLNDFRAVNTPVIARLMNTLGPQGLADLGKEGVGFAQLESKFEWLLRKNGDLYILKDGRTKGSSIGLTFEGEINGQTQRIDIHGNVVPMSEVNNFISNIPLVGTILSGGSEGGVFAATYTIKGPQKKPEVSINPLSIIAPGIIRRILFEQD